MDLDSGGMVASVISFFRSLVGGVQRETVKGDPDGGFPITFEHTSSPGDDSPPLGSDSLTGIEIAGEGHFAAIGYTDPLNEGVALQGEKRIYSRDENGAVVSSVHLKRDGRVEVQNALGGFILTKDGGLEVVATTIKLGNGIGSMELNALGFWTINGVSFPPSGDVISATGISLSFHLTTAVTPGAGTSGPPV